MQPQSRKAYDFWEAGRALRGLMRDPSDVSCVFRIINSLPGHAFERVVSRLQSSATGRRLLVEQPALLDKLRDRAYLAALPEGSLGREYLHFMERENINAQGLVDADEFAGWDADRHTQELVFTRRWLRDSHDLWHVVTGYHGDLLGEPALVAFQWVQNCWHPGFAFISFMLFVKGGIFKDMRRMLIEGFWRGLRSDWFPGADWASLLAVDLAEVQRQLQVVPLRPYKPLRVSDLPGGKLPSI